MTENNNIYDTANQLERDLRALPAYNDLKESVAAIEANDESRELFKEFRAISQQLQQKQMQGEAPTEEEIANIQAMSVKVQEDENINRLMASEQQVSQTINDINQIITKPLNEVYQYMSQ